MFMRLGLDWVTPLLLMSRSTVPPLSLVAVAIALNGLSLFWYSIGAEPAKGTTSRFRTTLT